MTPVGARSYADDNIHTAGSPIIGTNSMFILLCTYSLTLLLLLSVLLLLAVMHRAAVVVSSTRTFGVALFCLLSTNREILVLARERQMHDDELPLQAKLKKRNTYLLLLLTPVCEFRFYVLFYGWFFYDDGVLTSPFNLFCFCSSARQQTRLLRFLLSILPSSRYIYIHSFIAKKSYYYSLSVPHRGWGSSSDWLV